MEKEQQRERILSNPKPLSPNQRRAVLSDKRHIRIIAGAGAGKTETLTRRIVYHLIYEEIDPAAIVAFTFTDKAAERHISGIVTKDFRPQSGQHCRSCDYGAICKCRGY
ncbi:MAG: UvrD-helicase domain-containing protein [Methanothrix sp.]